MPLPVTVPRQPIHRRTIDLNCYEREDGLWDIEAQLIDTKGYTFENAWRGTMPPGTPVHEMWLRLTVDDDFIIHDVAASTDHSPFEMCPAITGHYRRLIGAKIGPGWRKIVRSAVGGTEGCTHHTELLGPLATIVYQTIGPMLERKAREKRQQAADSGQETIAPEQRMALLNTCHALAEDSPMVRDHWPEHYKGP